MTMLRDEVPNALSSEQLEYVACCPIFRGLSASRLAELVAPQLRLRFFQGGTVIYSPTDFERSLGIVLAGSAIATKKGSVILNTFQPGSCFGVATLFSNSRRYVATVQAKSPCLVAMLSGAQLQELFRLEPTITQNYIAFLYSRIHFLNRKIDAFTAVTADEAVALYLLEQLEHGNPICLDLSYAKLADTLALGRSTLYRSFAILEEAGILRKNGRVITILDPDGLEQWADGTRGPDERSH